MIILIKISAAWVFRLPTPISTGDHLSKEFKVTDIMADNQIIKLRYLRSIVLDLIR